MIKRDENQTAFTDLKNSPIADSVREYRKFSPKSPKPIKSKLIQETRIKGYRPSLTADQICCQLRVRLEIISSAPLPARLASLTEQLQAALDRGELFTAKPDG
jgi:hypothetical protein